MARAQIGNVLGVTAKDPGPVVAEITADGANTVTVAAADVHKFRIGQSIDLVNKSTGAVLAAARTIDGLTGAGVITYSGADVAAVPGTHAVYLTGDWEATPTGAFARDAYTNLNGGTGDGSGFVLNRALTIDELRLRLTAISATAYSVENLDRMTYNDMLYALRAHDAPGSIK